jgi:MFS family permease
MVASASMAGRLVPRIGTKPLFISALLAIPLRGVFIVLLLQSELAFKNSFLLATQILDGLAGGIFGVLLVLITENLSRYFNVKN